MRTIDEHKVNPGNDTLTLTVLDGPDMTDEQMQDLVTECGLDWHRGYMPLFDGDPTNRYAVLIEATVAAERERARLS